MEVYKVHWFDDSGHEWLSVKRQWLVDLKIIDKVSDYSYERGERVYLECDCDASLFLNAIKGKRRENKVTSYNHNAPIRSYRYFILREGE